MKKFNVMLLLICVSINLFAGPFNLDMGDTLTVLKNKGVKPEDLNNGYYRVTPTALHPEFEDYIVRLDETEGIFWIKAIGKDISDNGYGFSIKRRFSDILTALQNQYGDGEFTDYLMYGSIWDEPDDFLMSIYKQDRIYLNKFDHATSEIPSLYSSIYLGISSLGSSKGYLVLEYYSKDFDRLKEKAQKKVNAVF